MVEKENHIDLDDVEVKLGELEAEFVEINANNDKLQRSYNELMEYKLVLQKAGEFFSSAHRSATAQRREIESQHAGEDLLESPLLQEEKSIDSTKQVKLGFLTGLVPHEKSMMFERILVRATRGNIFIRQTVIEEPVIDPNSGEKAEKNVFVVFYYGERAKSKILKICEAFGANRYPFSEALGRQAQMMTEVSGRLTELKTTIDAGFGHRNSLLHTIGDKFELWNLKVRKEKAIYHTLNMLSLDVTKKCLVAEGWSPVFASKEIQDALQRAALDSNSQVRSIFQVFLVPGSKKMMIKKWPIKRVKGTVNMQMMPRDLLQRSTPVLLGTRQIAISADAEERQDRARAPAKAHPTANDS